MTKSPHIVVIDHYTTSIKQAVRVLRAQSEFRELGVVVLTTQPDKYASLQEDEVPVTVLACDFEEAAAIQEILKSYYDGIVGVICRGDKQVQYLRRVIPCLPPGVRVASPESLEAATNKQLMRAAFQRHAPEITPQFVEASDDIAASVQLVESKLDYPVIVKPANLVSSLLIQSCANRTELTAALQKVYDRIHAIYAREERRDPPRVLVEEYLEGDFYSIDAYIMEPGQTYYCPPVAYIPAKQIGIDDFFLYKRFVPTTLTPDEVRGAEAATAKALAAVGLTHSSAHVELVLTKHGWKIIELGPRLGRFRNSMYRLAYGIDHSLNDVKIHLGLEPAVGDALQRHCSAYSIYPDHEGMLTAIHGIERLAQDPRVSVFKVFAEPGAPCHFAKHGGHALAEFIVADADPVAFQKLVNYIEREVHAEIRADIAKN